jgi:regulator of RNase E activity RraB
LSVCRVCLSTHPKTAAAKEAHWKKLLEALLKEAQETKNDRANLMVLCSHILQQIALRDEHVDYQKNKNLRVQRTRLVEQAKFRLFTDTDARPDQIRWQSWSLIVANSSL